MRSTIDPALRNADNTNAAINAANSTSLRRHVDSEGARSRYTVNERCAAAMRRDDEEGHQVLSTGRRGQCVLLATQVTLRRERQRGSAASGARGRGACGATFNRDVRTAATA